MENNKKVAVVVGASSGIGYHSAIRLTEKGYRVYNMSRTNCKDSRVFNINADVEKPASIALAFKEFLDKENKLDVLIYSAGYSMCAPIEYAKMKDITKLFKVNYFGAITVLQHVIPLMKENNDGRIILISSLASTMPVPFDSFYSSSKAALDMLAKGLNLELEPFGIKATSVQPGGTATHFTFKRNVYSDDLAKDYAPALKYANEVIERAEQGGMSASSVAESIVELLEFRSPPQTTSCGILNKTLKAVHKIVPDRLAAYLNKNQYKPPQPEQPTLH